MTLRSIGNWVLDANIFILLLIILIFLLVFGYLWLIYDLHFNSEHYPEGDIRNTTNWDSFDYKKDRFKLITKLIVGFCFITWVIILFFTQ